MDAQGKQGRVEGRIFVGAGKRREAPLFCESGVIRRGQGVGVAMGGVGGRGDEIHAEIDPPFSQKEQYKGSTPAVGLRRAPCSRRMERLCCADCCSLRRASGVMRLGNFIIMLWIGYPQGKTRPFQLALYCAMEKTASAMDCVIVYTHSVAIPWPGGTRRP